MDGRCHTFRVVSESKALDTAHVRNDWSAYLDAVDRINRAFVGIADTARRWAADVTAAPAVDPNQLPLPLAA